MVKTNGKVTTGGWWSVRRVLACIVVTVLTMAGCSEGGEQFPTGTFLTESGTIVTFNEDETHDVVIDGELVLPDGPYVIEGTEITFAAVPGCGEGRYTWHYDRDTETLEFDLIEDPACPKRKADLSSPLIRQG